MTVLPQWVSVVGLGLGSVCDSLLWYDISMTLSGQCHSSSLVFERCSKEGLPVHPLLATLPSSRWTLCSSLWWGSFNHCITMFRVRTDEGLPVLPLLAFKPSSRWTLSSSLWCSPLWTACSSVAVVYCLWDAILICRGAGHWGRDTRWLNWDLE